MRRKMGGGGQKSRRRHQSKAIDVLAAKWAGRKERIKGRTLEIKIVFAGARRKNAQKETRKEPPNGSHWPGETSKSSDKLADPCSKSFHKKTARKRGKILTTESNGKEEKAPSPLGQRPIGRTGVF